MQERILYSLLAFLFLCLPVIAEDHEGVACNKSTGECYNAEVSLEDGVVVINFSETDSLILELDDDYPNDLTAYDETKDIYYDIEILD